MANAQVTPSGGLVLIRITLGALVTRAGWAWAANDELTASVVKATVKDHLGSLSAPLRVWGDTILLYNPDAVAFLVSWLTLFAGVALFLGALTRPAAVFVAFLALNLFIYDSESLRPLMLLVSVSTLGCAISRAGRRFGLDAALDGNLPTWMTWVKRDAGFLGR